MEWVVLIVTIIVFNVVFFSMNKHLSPSELYTTIIFGLFVSVLADLFASFRFSAWGFFETGIPEFSGLFIVVGIYPAAAAMIINWYPYHSTRFAKVAYLIGWAIFSTGYEWLAIQVDFLWHENWNLIYSFILYPFLYYMLIIHVRVFRWMNDKKTVSKKLEIRNRFLQIFNKKTEADQQPNIIKVEE